MLAKCPVVIIFASHWPIRNDGVHMPPLYDLYTSSTRSTSPWQCFAVIARKNSEFLEIRLPVAASFIHGNVRVACSDCGATALSEFLYGDRQGLLQQGLSSLPLQGVRPDQEEVWIKIAQVFRSAVAETFANQKPDDLPMSGS
jgi:hypothetical protein